MQAGISPVSLRSICILQLDSWLIVELEVTLIVGQVIISFMPPDGRCFLRVVVITCTTARMMTKMAVVLLV
jgi:hypothetical protein